MDPLGLESWTFGVSGYAMFGPVGVGSGFGVAWDGDTTVCVYGNLMGAFFSGFGVYAGGGLNVGYSANDPRTGFSGNGEFFREGGVGATAGLSLGVDDNNNISGAKGFFGRGAGGAFGTRGVGTGMLCFGGDPDSEPTC